MTWNLCFPISFIHDGTVLTRVQLLLTLLLGIWAIRLAYLIYIRQNKNLSKDAILNRALQKVIMLTIDINTWQRKLEYLTILLKEAEEKWNIELVKIHTEWLDELKCSLDNYYKSRDETLELYDKEMDK